AVRHAARGRDLRDLWRGRHGDGIRRSSIHQVPVHDRGAVDGDVLCVEFQTLRAATLAGFHHGLRRYVSSMFMVACCIAYWRGRFYRRAFSAEFSYDPPLPGTVRYG